jgi:hypothetical protein
MPAMVFNACFPPGGSTRVRSGADQGWIEFLRPLCVQDQFDFVLTSVLGEHGQFGKRVGSCYWQLLLTGPAPGMTRKLRVEYPGAIYHRRNPWGPARAHLQG